MDEPQPHGDNNGHIIMTSGAAAGNINSETEDSDSDDEENERGHNEDRGIILMEEIEDEELDSVSVVARSTRDRLSGTGSTQSEDSSHHSGGSAVNGGTSEASASSGGACSNSSTLSNDSGIAEEFLHGHNHLRGATRRHNANGGSKAARPIRNWFWLWCGIWLCMQFWGILGIKGLIRNIICRIFLEKLLFLKWYLGSKLSI